MSEIYYYTHNGKTCKINNQNLQMIWCAVEEQLYQWGENGRSDPRFNLQDWRDTLAKIESMLEMRLPKKL